jgi:hypothetical protein
MAARRLSRVFQHPVGALLFAVVFASAGLLSVPHIVDVADQPAIANEPTKVADQALDRGFNAQIAEREIRATLDAGANCAARAMQLRLARFNRRSERL